PRRLEGEDDAAHREGLLLAGFGPGRRTRSPGSVSLPASGVRAHDLGGVAEKTPQYRSLYGQIRVRSPSTLGAGRHFNIAIEPGSWYLWVASGTVADSRCAGASAGSALSARTGNHSWRETASARRSPPSW